MGAAGGSVGACPAGLDTSAATAPQHGLPAVRSPASGVAVGATKALIGGFVPTGGPVWLLVEYGRGPSYGSCSAWQRNVAAETVARIQLKGLQPSATYHFRLVAKTAAATVFGTDRTFETLAGGHIPQGVEIGTIAVGGMNRAAAIAQLNRPLASPLRLDYAGAFWHVTRAQAGARVDSAHAVATALTAAPGEALPATSLSIDQTRLNAFLAKLNRRWGRAARPATVKLVGTHAVVEPARPGTTLDTRRTAALIESALESGARELLSLAVEPDPEPAGPTKPEKAVVVRLGSQTLTAYLNGKPVLTAPVTTGRPALPTPIGSYFVHFRASPYTFISPWPVGSAYYYPPAPVTWAMLFYNGDFLHDDPAEPSDAFGAGSNLGPYASHGCVHVPHDAMAFLYNWLPVGAPVIVSQT